MAFTTPRTWVSGEIATAANLNTHLRDNVAWLATDSPACRVYKSTNYSHTSTGNYLAVTYDSERFDNAAMHSTVSQTDRITVPSGGAGKYLIGFTLLWSANGTGTRYGAVGVSGITTFAGQQSGAADASFNTSISVCTTYTTAVADYFTTAAWQNSGGNLNVLASANFSPEFFAFWFRT